MLLCSPRPSPAQLLHMYMRTRMVLVKFLHDPVHLTHGLLASACSMGLL